MGSTSSSPFLRIQNLIIPRSLLTCPELFLNESWFLCLFLIDRIFQVQAGKLLDIPLLVTEHYPEKLGRIVKDLDISHAKAVIPKTLFSMVVPELETKIKELFPTNPPESVVLFGLEAHICVEQTAIDLLARDYQIHLVADCSMSRTQEDRLLAFKRLQQQGCFLTTSESVIFKLMKDKNHPKFDVVRKLVNNVSEDTGLAKL